MLLYYQTKKDGQEAAPKKEPGALSQEPRRSEIPAHSRGGDPVDSPDTWKARLTFQMRATAGNTLKSRRRAASAKSKMEGMAMLNELKNGKFIQNIATPDEVAAFVKEAKRMVNDYGWQDRTVTPWGYAEKVTKTIKDIEDFRRCTFSSKQMLITLANGLAKVMNAWEQQELTGISLRSVKTGKIVKVGAEIVDLYLDNGFVIV